MKTWTLTEQQCVGLVREYPGISQMELARALGKARTTILSAMLNLCVDGIIIIEKNGHAVNYFVDEKKLAEINYGGKKP